MQTDRSTHVTVLAPESHQDRRYLLGEDDLLVGRAEACDLRFDDPYLSRVHAKIEVRSGRARIRDLGSSGGTWVNDAPVTGVVELHDGDVVTLGQVRLRVSSDDSGTRVLPTLGPATAVAALGRRTCRRGAPLRCTTTSATSGGTRSTTSGATSTPPTSIERESFLREVAATRTKARWLLWTGFIVFVIGFGVQLSGSMDYLQGITGAIEQGLRAASGTTNPPALPSMGSFQPAFIGAAVSSLGVVLFVVGLVLHVVAASRRKRVDRELPSTPGPTSTEESTMAFNIGNQNAGTINNVEGDQHVHGGQHTTARIHQDLRQGRDALADLRSALDAAPGVRRPGGAREVERIDEALEGRSPTGRPLRLRSSG